jgi:hypothetical protein
MSMKKLSQERMDALRQEPEYQDLLRALKRQEPERIEAFSEDILTPESEELDHEHDETD